MSKESPTHRGDLMRRIAASYAKFDSLGRSDMPSKQREAERQDLKKLIADLKQQMMR